MLVAYRYVGYNVYGTRASGSGASEGDEAAKLLDAVARDLERMFTWRHARTRHDLHHHARFAGERLHVAVSGSNGLVGGSLVPFLTTAGHDVRRIVRGKANHAHGDVAWDQRANTFDASALEGLDAVVHLAGAGIADERWSAARKQEIRDSRVKPTEALARTLAGLKRKPRVLVCASAVGWYGNRPGPAEVDESSPRGDGFLPEICEEWERATDAARDAGIRVVNVRIGIVVSARGGALAAGGAFCSGGGGFGNAIGLDGGLSGSVQGGGRVVALWACGPITARAAGPVERLTGWARRNPALAFAASAAVLLLAALVAIEVRGNRRLTAAGRRLRANLYAADMALAATALDRDDLDAARRLLALHRPAAGEPDPRGIEWRVLARTALGDSPTICICVRKCLIRNLTNHFIAIFIYIFPNFSLVHNCIIRFM
jgi:hypothetical protein